MRPWSSNEFSVTLDNREARRLAYEMLQLVDQRVDRELSACKEEEAFRRKEPT